MTKDADYQSKLSRCNIMTLEELALDESSIVGKKAAAKYTNKSRILSQNNNSSVKKSHK
jgi:hypothetical protein